MPLIRVRLWLGDHSTPVDAVVDSGAEFSLFDLTYADVLGLDRGTSVMSASLGASGTSFPTFHWPDAQLEIEFQGERLPFRGAFAAFPPVTADALNLLGRADFFQRFIIQFWDAAELMNIDVSPDFPRAAQLP